MATVPDMAFGIGLALLKLVIGLVLSMGSIYIGLRAFDRMTPGIEEMEEIKKGNVAVGILMAAVVISIATVVQSGVQSFGNNIAAGMSVPMIAIALTISTANLLFSVLVAVFSLYIAMRILDRITEDINETEEFKQGNVAVAVMEAGVLIAVAFVIQASIGDITSVSLLDPKAIAGALGIA
jgi:uncharacterized membrane protein YjfL (UPF0719 family)